MENEENKSESLGSLAQIALLVIFFIPIPAFNFLFDGLGISRVSDYWKIYRGSMSYSEIPVYFKLDNISGNLGDTYSWEVLQFGYELDGKQELHVSILESAIPKEDIGHVFYDINRFNAAPLTIGKTYLAVLDIRGNYFSYLFTDKKAFTIYKWEEMPDETLSYQLEPNKGWPYSYTLYAIACWCQMGLLLPALFAVFYMSNYNHSSMPLAIVSILGYMASVGYLFSMDVAFFNSWLDWVMPGIMGCIGVFLMGWMAHVLFFKKKA